MDSNDFENVDKCEQKQYFLNFLLKYQPLPPDSEITEDELLIYDKSRFFFENNPCASCIPLFLNSFGEGSGFGVYQLIDSVIRKFSMDEVVGHLIKALTNKQGSIQYWCIQITVDFPHASLIPILESLLYVNETNYCDATDIKSAVITTLEAFTFKEPDKSLEIRNIFLKFIDRETDLDLIEKTKECLL